MSSPPDNVGEDINMFSGCPSAGVVRSFVQTDVARYLMNVEQSWWNLQGIFTSAYWWPGWILEVRTQKSKVKVITGTGSRGSEGIHVDAGTSKSSIFLVNNSRNFSMLQAQ